MADREGEKQEGAKKRNLLAEERLLLRDNGRTDSDQAEEKVKQKQKQCRGK